MSRDYSKKKTARRKPAATTKNKTPQRSFGVLVYLFVGLSVALFIAFLWFLGNQPEQNQQLVHPSKNTLKQQKVSKNKPNSNVTKATKTSRSKTSVVSSNNKKMSKKPELPDVPKYTFYTMLPDVEVESNEPIDVVAKKQLSTGTSSKTNSKTRIPSKHGSPITKTNVKPLSKPKKLKTLYQLQVGAFQTKAKAEAIKAKLGFMGVQSSLSTARLNNGKRIYRVRIGPSSDEKKLKFIKAKLERMNIMTFLQKA